jgi:phosphoglucomutase
MNKKIISTLTLLVIIANSVNAQLNINDKKICKKIQRLNFKKIEKQGITVDSIVNLINFPIVDTYFYRTNPAILEGITLSYSRYILVNIKLRDINSCDVTNQETWDVRKLFKEKVLQVSLSCNSKIIK